MLDSKIKTDEFLTFKVVSTLGADFDTFVATIYRNARNKDKHPEFDTLLEHVKEEEIRMKNANMNPARHNSDDWRQSTLNFLIPQLF